MRDRSRLAVSVVILVGSISPCFAQTGAKLHEIDALITKGVFTVLDPEMMKHRLTLAEIEAAKLTGEPTDIDDLLTWMARCEKMNARVEEPLEVRGRLAVGVPPNSLGDEAFTACFYALSFNGLGLTSLSGELVLVRPEKHPRLELIGQPWDRERILSTELFRLGYLKPDPIMRRYTEKLGTSRGHAVIENRSNVLIVTDTPKALKSLRTHVDSEILEAMGLPVTVQDAPAEAPRHPSLGAIVSRSAIHFYLMTFARWNQYALAATRQNNRISRYYSEADLWTDEHSYTALAAEYRRISEYVQLANETGAQGWDDPNPERTLSPADQKRLAIRFGVNSPALGTATPQKSKKAARKR